MRVLVISDIHANLVALEAVLAAAAGQYEAVWFLGDLVGYGPDPNECRMRLQSLPGLRALVGNHDHAAAGKTPLEEFNDLARIALSWTRAALDSDTLDYLNQLPERLENGNFTLVHGSPRVPVWEYILDGRIAAQNFYYFETPVCLVGHTHAPVVYRQVGLVCQELWLEYQAALDLRGDRFILNPGSVGQPRDGDPHAAYALLDTATAAWRQFRAPYDIVETQRRMEAIDMPAKLILRLEQGW